MRRPEGLGATVGELGDAVAKGADEGGARDVGERGGEEEAREGGDGGDRNRSRVLDSTNLRRATDLQHPSDQTSVHVYADIAHISRICDIIWLSSVHKTDLSSRSQMRLQLNLKMKNNKRTNLTACIAYHSLSNRAVDLSTYIHISVIVLCIVSNCVSDLVYE